MALFYYSTNGFEWVECSANILNSECDEFRYLSALDECVWFGNRCAGNDMYSIIFDNNGLSGGIPSEISNLSSLQEIKLTNNEITGIIPPSLTSLSSLRVIDLNNNDISGPIPDSFGGNLQVLDVSYNQLNGDIPDSLGDANSLVVGKFQSNDIQGNMPDSVCQNVVPDGNIQILESDCNGDNPKVLCDCCTQCFAR